MHTRKIWIVSPQQVRQIVIADICAGAGAFRENIFACRNLAAEQMLAHRRPQADIIIMDYPYKIDAMDPTIIEAIRRVYPAELIVIALLQGDGYDAAALHHAGADFVIQTSFAVQSEALGPQDWQDILKYRLKYITEEAPILH